MAATNKSDVLRPDLCIIGGGSAGLSLAAGASQMGAATVMIESGPMGGDCLNFGCVPSKSLIRCGKAAHDARQARHLGVQAERISIDQGMVREHIQNVISAIEPHDSVERFTELGVQVIQEHGAFLHADEVLAGKQRIRARRFVIATGSRPAIPPIPGLSEVPYLTNETIFGFDGEIERLLIIGAGPIGCELAQAFARLDIAVSLIDLGSILPREDDEMRAEIRRQLLRDGVNLWENASIGRVDNRHEGVGIDIECDGSAVELRGSHVLVAAGRRPNIESLGLDRAGIKTDRNGIRVNRCLRTSNWRVYAIGDCNGIAQFTHAAGYQAGVALKNILLRVPASASAPIPRVTFTDPELAYVGKTQAELDATHTSYRTVRSAFADNDRARADGHVAGCCKILVSANGRILGAGLLGHHAGDLIAPWVFAVEKKLKLSDMASSVMPYPTYVEINKRTAGQHFAPKIFGERMKSIVRFLAGFG